MKFNNVNPNGENVIATNLKLFYSFFLKIIKIEVKMKLQSFLLFGLWSLTKCPQNMTFCIFHLTYWNEMNQNFPCS